MFQRILIATDGQPHSDRAMEQGIALAAQLLAELHLVHVRKPFEPALLISYPIPVIDDQTRIDYDQSSREHAQTLFDEPRRRAEAAGLKVITHVPAELQAWEGILDTAVRIKADLIVMATHGRGSLKTFLLGSQTQKLLTQCTIPVLAVR